MKLIKTAAASLLLLVSCGAEEPKGDPTIDFLNERFGMFIHYNMSHFHGEQWATPGRDPKTFAPTKLDCKQWAKVAKSAGMSYGVLTTKHHDGFCLWDSSVTDYDVASSSYDGDIVKEYADAFRSEGLNVGLYFSVWDRQHGIETKAITEEKIEYLKSQLTELLTAYGQINTLVIDGWGSAWGRCPTFEELPYHLLADHIHSLQPNCLIANHSCRTSGEYTDIVHYEATHGQHCPYDNTIPSQQGPTLQPKWFWVEGDQDLDLKPLEEIIGELEFCNSHYANYLLNASPNVNGSMDENVVERLKQVGKVWQKPAPITSLPAERQPHANVVATATQSGESAPELLLDANLFTYWEPAADDATPSVTLDFGREERFNKVVCGEGKWAPRAIEAFKIEAQVDGKWQTIAEGEKMGNHWESSFEDVTARKFRLTITQHSRLPRVAEFTMVHYEL